MGRRKTDQQVLDDHSIATPGGCIIWVGATNKGYGKLTRDGVTWGAHRFAWTIRHGEIPPGQVIDHLCRRPLCINTSHMEVTTIQINTLRGLSSSAFNAVKTACKRGHAFDEKNTRIVVRKGKPGRHCLVCKSLYTVAYRKGLKVDELLELYPGIDRNYPTERAA